MRLRILLAGLGLTSAVACNPVDASRTFDSSRGTTRYVLVTRFPMDPRPRAFEQAGPTADWAEIEIADASGLKVEVHGRQLLIPAVEENVVLEYYDRELDIPVGRTAQAVLRELSVVRVMAQPCMKPLCYPNDYCQPASPNLVSSATAGAALGVAAFLLGKCP